MTLRQQLLPAAVGFSRLNKTLLRRGLLLHLLLHHGFRRGTSQVISSSTSASSKDQDAATPIMLIARTSQPPLHNLEQRNPPPTIRSRLPRARFAPPSADCFLFDPQSSTYYWRQGYYYTICSHTAAQLDTKICKLQIQIQSNFTPQYYMCRRRCHMRIRIVTERYCSQLHIDHTTAAHQ